MYKVKKTSLWKIKDCALAKDSKQSRKLINQLLGTNQRANNIFPLNIDDTTISDRI